MKIKYIFLLIFLSVFCINAYSQSIKGIITDEKGEPLIATTIYVREIRQGTIANEKGEFQLNLPQGSYTCEISSLGYEKQILEVKFTSQITELRIVLKPAVYMLPEVRVTSSGEDPAYYIMRHAIANAPAHRHQVESYNSEVYTKGNMQLDKFPKVLPVGAETRKIINSLKGKLFLLESVEEIAFKAPNEYEKKVVAFSSTIPDDLDAGDAALGIITASIYEPEINGVVSPLSPGAFNYYRFKYEDSYMEGERTINKIRVDPKKKNSKLLKGWVYISDNDWSVVRFDFQTEIMGIVLNLKSSFHEVHPEVFLPTSYNIDVDVKVFGIKAEGKYYASIKYNEVELSNKSAQLTSNTEIQKEELSSKKQKMLQQIEELSEKDELTTKEAYRMARLTQEVLKPERGDSIPPLEIRFDNRQEKVSVDSLATQRDSLFWLNVRAIPLNTQELVSYEIKDSIKYVIDDIRGELDSTSSRYSSSTINKVLLGGRFRLNKNMSLSIGGLVKAVPEYNFVDGFWVGQDFGLTINLEKGRSLRIKPDIYFATARKSVVWRTGVSYRYSPMKRGRLNIKFGDESTDYNRVNGAKRWENTFSSILIGDNFMKFYGRRFFEVNNSVDIANGLVLSVFADYEKRRIFENNISYNLFKRSIDTNAPEEEGGVSMPPNSAGSFAARISYTPRYFYQIYRGRKYYSHSNWPTFNLMYRKGLTDGRKLHHAYDRIDIGINQKIKLGIFDNISYSFTAGQFFNKKKLYFPDYRHFNTSGWFLARDMSTGSGYFLADYYELSTDRKWISGALNYTSSYLFIKRLPFLQRYLLKEAIHLRYLWTPENRNYYEAGYSIGIEDAFNAGVFFNFRGDEYLGVGFRLNVIF